MSSQTNLGLQGRSICAKGTVAVSKTESVSGRLQAPNLQWIDWTSCHQPRSALFLPVDRSLWPRRSLNRGSGLCRASSLRGQVKTSSSRMAEDSLPFSLILLVDLHLLHFPLNDSVNYDENLFNPHKRGIGERSRFLEDISFFLVSKIEGSKSSAKKVYCLRYHDLRNY